MRLTHCDPRDRHAPDESGLAICGDIAVVHVPSAVTYVVGAVRRINGAGEAIEVDTGVYVCDVAHCRKTIIRADRFALSVRQVFGTYASLEHVEAALTPHEIVQTSTAAEAN